MLCRTSCNRSRRLFAAGILLLSIATAAHQFHRQVNHDGLYGVFVGIAIGLLLCALRSRRG